MPGSVLSIRTNLEPGEPPAYFAARLAALNQRQAASFASDMELDVQGLLDGRQDDVQRLADLTDVPFDTLIADAQIRRGRSWFRRGQELRKIDLRRTRLMICPLCLADDIARSDLPDYAAIFCRADWALAFVRTCPTHGLALVELIKRLPARLARDWTAQARLAIPRLAELADGALRRQPSALERYLFDRLAGRATGSWLDAFPLFAALRVAELVGAVAEFGPSVALSRMTDEDSHQAGNTGAEIASGGPPAFLDLLSQINSQYVLKRKGGSELAQGVFGRLYTVTKQNLNEPAYNPLREEMGRFILDNFALGPGDLLFDKPVTERRKHSIRSACVEFGFTHKRLRKILAAEGLIATPEAHDRDIHISVEDAERLARREKDILSVLKLEKYINAPIIQTRILRSAGFIKRHTSGKGMYDYYLKSEVDEFLSRLFADAIPVAKASAGLAPLAIAARRAYEPMSTIVQMILDKKLTKVGRLDGIPGFRSLVVDVAEVREKTRRPELPGMPLRELVVPLKTRYQVIDQLIDCGALKVVSTSHPLNRAKGRVVEFDELARFQRRYVSLHCLAIEVGEHMNLVNQRLRGNGICPVNFPGVEATFYHRQDVVACYPPRPAD